MIKNKQFPFLILLSVLAANLILGYQVHNTSTSINKADQVESVRVLVDAVKILRKNYVDKDKVVYQKLIYSALQGMLEELDEHSRFHTPAQNAEVKEDTEGQFAGIGVTLNFLKKKLVIKKIIPDGPASKSALLPGDLIVAVDGVSLINKSFKEAKTLIKGEVGTEMVLTVEREEADATLEIPIVRDIVSVPSIVRNRILPGTNLGYLHIVQFSRNTSDEFEEKVKELQKQDIDGLIVDLRGNPGGMLSSAVQLCSFFLEEDDLVIYTKGRDKQYDQKYKAFGGTKFALPLVILVDSGSASASEILSACLQDYGKAILVGEKTYGKGSVQTIVDLRDGSALRFTIAKYYTKSGRTIHKFGIKPDLWVQIKKEEKKELNEHLRDLFPTADELDSFDKKDTQLKAAVSLLKDLTRLSVDQPIQELYKKNVKEYKEKYSVILPNDSEEEGSEE